jgi:hypothetical protein
MQDRLSQSGGAIAPAASARGLDARGPGRGEASG